MLNLPEEIAAALKPLLDALPIEQAMPHLLGSSPHHAELVEQALQQPALTGRSDLAAGLWLYVDDLERSHNISQSNNTATGAYWHGVMHRREGDFSNSHYWMRQTMIHPMHQLRPDLDPHVLIDQVAAAGGKDDPALVARQREEWRALFEWCAANP